MISDQGREFVNKVNKKLFSITKTEHRISSAYHPQTNGLVQRFNQTLQRSLVKKFVNSNQTDWDEKLDGVLFAYRTSQQKSTNHTPFELMYVGKCNSRMEYWLVKASMRQNDYSCSKAVLPLEMALMKDQPYGSDDSSED